MNWADDGARRGGGKNGDAALCCCDSNWKGKWVWGLTEMPPPGARSMLPGAAQWDDEGGGLRSRPALIPCHEWKRGRRSELVSCIEICPKGYIYKRRPQTLD